MTGTSAGDALDAPASVRVQPWHRAHPPASVGGSLYAVAPAHRVLAARELVAEGCRVHADVILDEAGRQVGVTWAELAEVRRVAPDAQIDLHLIHLGEPRPEQLLVHLDRALQAAAQLRVSAVTLAPAQITGHRRRLERLRAAGHQLWVEVHPNLDETELDGLDVDGALVMFIRPGTRDAADLAQLPKVARLSQRYPVAVDGGITRSVAATCRDSGASYLVSGRDLLTVETSPVRPSPQKDLQP